jgi:hypothetical protein
VERTWSKSGFMAEKSRFALCATGTVRCAACSLSRFHRSISFADETDDAMPTALSRPAPGRVEVLERCGHRVSLCGVVPSGTPPAAHHLSVLL